MATPAGSRRGKQIAKGESLFASVGFESIQFDGSPWIGLLYEKIGERTMHRESIVSTSNWRRTP